MIRITQLYRPFFLEVGESCFIPGTSWIIKAYPTRFELSHLQTQECILGIFELVCPIREFIMTQDIEKQRVYVRFRTPKGLLSYFFSKKGQNLCLSVKRCSSEGIYLECQEKRFLIQANHNYLLANDSTATITSLEKLSLGCHKKQDWQRVKRRLLLEEILPIWFSLGNECV